jgi:polyhydroxyalkanoate synthase
LRTFQKIEKAVRAESETRESKFLKGIERYQNSKFIGPQESEPTTILEGDHCNLRFFASGDRKRAEKKPLLLAIPSLVNKHYILDLMPQTSVVQHFNHEDFDVCLVEWHAPTDEDHSMGVEDYTLALLSTLQMHWEVIDRPILTLGYCLGGVLSTALACLFPRVVGMVLLATPWDFSLYSFAKMDGEQRQSLRQKIEKNPRFAAEHVQSLCYLANATRVISQYSEFADSNNMRGEMNFVAIQHWANDGVDVTQAVARQCLLDWPTDNPLVKGEWEVSGQPIRPEELDIPVFAAIPTRDNIVPYKCAVPLADKIKNMTLITPSSGHVGMVAGIEQSERLMLPLKRWAEQF